MAQQVRGSQHVQKRASAGIAFNFPEWQAAKQYIKNDRFLHNDEEYFVITDHLSPAAFDPGLVELRKSDAGLRRQTVPTSVELRAVSTPLHNELRRIAETGEDYRFFVGVNSGDYQDDSTTGYWRSVHILSENSGNLQRNVINRFTEFDAPNFVQISTVASNDQLSAVFTNFTNNGATVTYPPSDDSVDLSAPIGARAFLGKGIGIGMKLEFGKKYVLSFDISNLITDGSSRSPRANFYGDIVSPASSPFTTDGRYAYIVTKGSSTPYHTDDLVRIGVGNNGNTTAAGSFTVSNVMYQEVTGTSELFDDYTKTLTAASTGPGNSIGVNNLVVQATGPLLSGTTHPVSAIGVIGDSFVNNSTEYPNLLLLEQNIYVSSDGVAGDQLTVGVLARIDAFLANPLTNPTTHIIVNAGINDILGGKTLLDMQTAWETIESKVLAVGKTPITINVSPYVSIETDPVKKQLLASWNTWLSQKADKAGYIEIDLHALLEDPIISGRMSPAYIIGAYTGDYTFTGDVIHPNDLAHSKIAELILNQTRTRNHKKIIKVEDFNLNQFQLSASGKIEIRDNEQLVKFSDLTGGLRKDTVANLTDLASLIAEDNELRRVEAEDADYIFKQTALTGDVAPLNGQAGFWQRNDLNADTTNLNPGDQMEWDGTKAVKSTEWPDIDWFTPFHQGGTSTGALTVIDSDAITAVEYDQEDAATGAITHKVWDATTFTYAANNFYGAGAGVNDTYTISENGFFYIFVKRSPTEFHVLVNKSGFQRIRSVKINGKPASTVDGPKHVQQALSNAGLDQVVQTGNFTGAGVQQVVTFPTPFATIPKVSCDTISANLRFVQLVSVTTQDFTCKVLDAAQGFSTANATYIAVGA
jgi:lysophospholipase L1-like esterase